MKTANEKQLLRELEYCVLDYADDFRFGTYPEYSGADYDEFFVTLNHTPLSIRHTFYAKVDYDGVCQIRAGEKWVDLTMGNLFAIMWFSLAILRNTGGC